MLETTCLMALVVIAAMGYFFYGKNVIVHEGKEFALLPWFIFAFLASLECLNIVFSTNVTPIEFIAGIVVFVGPVYISVLVIRTMWINLEENNKKTSFVVKRVLHESTDSPAQTIILLLGILIMVGLLFIEYLTPYGSVSEVEYGFAIGTILLDLVAVSSIYQEIKDDPQVFERSSWSCWIVSTGGAYLFNNFYYGEWVSIGSLLMIENFAVALVVFLCIQVYQKR